MMDRKALFWIVTLASIALLGFVAIQVYWIRNGLNIREANFRLAVDHAVRQVVYQLELQDAGLFLEGNPTRVDGSEQILGSMDSLRFSLNEYLKTLPTKPSLAPHKSYPKKAEMSISSKEVFIDPQAHKDTASIIVPGTFSSDNKDKTQGNPSIGKSDLLKSKQLIMDRLLEEVIQGRKMPQIEDRVTIGAIDTLLELALESRGISLEYSFGVFSPAKNIFVMAKSGVDRHALLHKGMVFPLFPSEYKPIPDYLLIWFPGEREALLNQLYGLTAISVLLLLVLMLSFAYSINTVLKQRKFAEMKNDFINNMTHEFKTPISTVSLACEALTDVEISKSESLYDEYINIISEENKRLGVMAEKILQTAIIEKGQVRLKRELFDLHLVIEEVIRNIRIQVEIKDGEILTNLKADQCLVEADKVHISNVVYNLLDNANKYSPRKPYIQVSTENIHQGIVVRVADKGIGISKTHQRKVFDRLYRVPMGDVHDFKGFGLGLSYVKAIVEQHGGNVGLDSEPGKGSEFRFYLPQSRQAS